MSLRKRRLRYTSAPNSRFTNSNNYTSRRWQGAGLLTTKIIVVTTVATCCHKLQTSAGPQYEFIRSVGGFGSGTGQFNTPSGIAIDPSGNIWVADTYNNRIQKFAGDGQFLQALGAAALTLPHGLAVDRSGNIWVANTFSHRVDEFAGDGRLLQTFGALGSGGAQFRYPISIAADSSGNIWVADSVNNRIQQFSIGGTFIREFGSLGSANGQFLDPHGIAVDVAGNIWAADERVQEFTSAGSFVQAFHTGEHGRPGGIALDSAGNIWVTSDSCVCEFASTGSLISEFGSQGRENGQLCKPKALAVDSAGNVWVADTGNNRIVEFSPVPVSPTLVLIAVAAGLVVCFCPGLPF
jgi:DNA-binding beta-propeller fold protein YncE